MDTDYDYKLASDAVVFDVGAYKGEFTDLIRRKYGCPVHAFEPVFVKDLKDRFKHDPLVWIYDCALDVDDKEAEIHVANDSTSMYFGDAPTQKIKVRDIWLYIRAQGLEKIDLLKLNCEGSEFPILEKLKEVGFISKVNHIAVQFHPHGHPGVDLSATHEYRHNDQYWKWLVKK